MGLFDLFRKNKAVAKSNMQLRQKSFYRVKDDAAAPVADSKIQTQNPVYKVQSVNTSYETSNYSVFIISGTILEKYTDTKFDGEVLIPDNITEIGKGAFSGCNISGVTIPSDCISICDNAFASCKNLKAVRFLGSGVRRCISDRVFYDCTLLEKVHMPNCFLIGKSIFEGCSNLKYVSFDNENRSIGAAMFKNCTGLEYVEFPQNLFSIMMEAFSGCSALTSVCLPNSLVKILEQAFENCTSLYEITIPSKVNVICAGCFLGCSSLKMVSLPRNLGIIEDYAFANCNIDCIEVPPSVFNIYNNAFDENTNIIGYKKRPVLFPDACKDVIGFSIVGVSVEPIYHSLFPIKPLDGYNYACAAINLMNGHLHRIDYKQIQQGVVLSNKEYVSGLLYDDLPELDKTGLYKGMTRDNWEKFIPKDAMESAKKNVIKSRCFDDSYTSEDNIGIDGLYIKLQQRYGSRVYYFRKTQVGYRLFKAVADNNIMLFDETKCNEPYIYSLFFLVNGHIEYMGASKPKDITLYKQEFLSIIQSAPQLFEGKYKGNLGKMNIPVSIYGDDDFYAYLWKDGKMIPCADFPGIEKVHDVLMNLMSDF